MFQWFGDKVRKVVDDAFEKRAMAAGRMMEAYAKSIVPVDTGLLRSTIGFMYERATRTLTLYANTHYALFVEMGTYRMRPQPYLRPALQMFAPGLGIRTNISLPTSLAPGHIPLKIQARIRPLISAANKQWNRGAVRRAALNVFHVDRRNEIQRPIRTDASHLLKMKKAWN